MPFDTLDYFVTPSAGIGKTASFTSAGPNALNAGTPPRGIKVKMIVSNIGGTTPTLAANIQESRDGGTTWLDCGTFKNPYSATTNTINANGEYEAFIHLPTLAAGVGVTTRQLRFNAVIAGTTPTMDLIVGMVPAFP